MQVHIYGLVMKPFKTGQIKKNGQKKSLFSSKNKWMVVSLIGIFMLVLFLNSYFNYTSGVAINEEGTSLEEKFYLSGPDPYYNMRLVQVTMETGHYPFVTDDDPLLNYPFGRSGARPPIFNMVTVGASKLFTPVLGETDALGYSMHILPALYGALLIIPVYLIGAALFGRKVGIIAALFTALIPIHISSGHGSAYSLYDHDSFNLLLFTFTFFFIIKSLRAKEAKSSVIYACLAGTTMATISMSWAAGRFIYAVIAVYAIVQMLVDIVTKKSVVSTARTTVIALFSGIIIASPYLFISGFALNVELILALIVTAFSGICLYLQSRNIPWILSLPTIFAIGGAAAVFLYVIRDATTGILGQLARFSSIIYGTPIYGSKVSLTIAEAGTYGFSRNVMSLGPVIYLLGWVGFVFLLYRYYKTKRRSYLFLATVFMVQIWLSSTAGRFLNDLVPLTALFAGWVTWVMIEKINFSEMVKTIRGIGGGWYGLKKAVKIRHIAGVVFLGLFVLFPNGWMAFDASVPSTLKQDFDIEGGAFGLSLHTEEYWVDALSWLNQQDNELIPADRPGFIAWWDYGFYESAIGGHPTVADNFQKGIPPASNFHTATNEQGAVSVLITRILDAVKDENGGKLPLEEMEVLKKYLGEHNATLFKDILEDPVQNSRYYGRPIGEQYGSTEYRIRAETAIYHDAVNIFNVLTDAELTWLYHDIQNVTGYSIRYYGVEGYDINIFNVFSFLADKGVFGYATDEDDYFQLVYVDEYGGEYTPDEITNMTQNERQTLGSISAKVIRKDAFFDTMVYKAYLGEAIDSTTFEQYFTTYQYSGYVSFLVQPTAGLRHFVPKYISPITEETPYYFARGSLCRGCPAVVIAKYYEGAYINGTITSEGTPVSAIIHVLDDYAGYSHDAVLTDDQGNFNLIAPAGNISLSIIPGSGQSQTALKTIIFNSTTNPQLFPLSEAEAMRQPGTNYSRTLDITLPRGILEGTAFWDKDGDEEYNETIDELLKDVKIQFGSSTAQTNSRGYYSIKNLVPGEYTLTGTKNGYETQTFSVVIKPGITATQNISLIPESVQVEGEVWFDDNNNNRQDINETMANIPMSFIITQSLDENSQNKTATTNQTGHYQLELVPATYSIQVDYTLESDSITYQYTYTSSLQISIGDGPKTKNIRLERTQQ